MRQRLISICIVGALLCGALMYARSKEEISSITESIEEIESAAGESPEDVKADRVKDVNQSEAEEIVENLQDIPDDDTWGKRLLDVQEGMENLKEWDYLQSVQEVSGGYLKGIYSTCDENYSYTCYEFYNHYEEYTADISAAFICVKDRESKEEEYFDIIDIPINKISDLYRGIRVNRINVMRDLNFDGYMDLEFYNQNNDSFSRSGYYFLWDEAEQRFVFNESAPRYIKRIDPERKRLTNSYGSSLEDDYYIYEYSDNMFTCKHLKISAEDLYGKKVTEKYFVNGKCIALLEMIKDEDGFKHYFYEEIGGTREEVQIDSSLMYDEISEMFFPEFDFWIKG